MGVGQVHVRWGKLARRVVPACPSALPPSSHHCVTTVGTVHHPSHARAHPNKAAVPGLPMTNVVD